MSLCAVARGAWRGSRWHVAWAAATLRLVLTRGARRSGGSMAASVALRLATSDTE